jgi:multidrug efflux pump subunit AcrB
VRFNLEKDIDVAFNEVQAKVNQAVKPGLEIPTKPGVRQPGL